MENDNRKGRPMTDARAVLYARVSTEEQGKGYSIDTQLDALRSYASEKGYMVSAEFTDHHTGTEIDRPGLNELYQHLEHGNIQSVVVHDIDRLSREVGNQAIIEMEMSKLGVRIEYVLGQYADTPEGELMKVVKAGIAQYENRQRVERSRRGKLGRAKAGYVICTGSRAPFGYDYKSEPHKGWFIVNEREAEVVRNIFAWLIDEGMSSYAIAQRLWNENILSKGDYSDVVCKKTGRAEWSPTTVRRIVSNTVYKGVWYYGKTRRKRVNGKMKQVRVPKSEWVAVPVPAIVDEDTWDQAQECLATNRQNAKRNAKRRYLLRGMVFCPCGRRRTGRYKNYLKRAYYRCPATEAEPWRNRCEYRFSTRQEILEDAVWNKVSEFLLKPDNLKEEIARRRAEAEIEGKRRQQRLDAIEGAIDEVDHKMGILLDQVLTGGFAQSIINQKRLDLVAQRDQLQGERSRLEQELEVITITPDHEIELENFSRRIAEALGEQTFEDKRRILELIKLRVDVLSPTEVKLSGIISPEGSIVDLSCLSAP